jgi:hypothetical protein
LREIGWPRGLDKILAGGATLLSRNDKTAGSGGY